MVTKFLDTTFQMEALDALIGTLQPDALTLREELLQLIPPRAAGRGRTRESFNARTGVTFDGVSLAETAANLTCRMIFHPERTTRLVEYNARDPKQPGLEKVLNQVINTTILNPAPAGLAGEIKRNVDFVILDHLLSLSVNQKASPAVQTIAIAEIETLNDQFKSLSGLSTRGRYASKLRADAKSLRDRAHYKMLHKRAQHLLDEPDEFIPIKILEVPPGSPIGAEFGCSFDDKMQINFK